MKSAKPVILLIEDNPVDQELFKIILSDTDFRDCDLKIGNTLEEGLDLLLVNDCDLILLDLYLPDSEDLQGLEKIRIKAPNLPIIIFSGLDDKKLSERAINKGAQDYLVKGEYGSKLLDKSLKYAIMRQNLILERMASEKKFIEGQEIERKRLARDIHDGIGQMLVAMKFKLAGISCDNAEKSMTILEEIEKILENTIEEARRVSENVLPRILSEYGIVEAIEHLVEGVISTTKKEINFNVEGTFYLNQLQETQLYRAIQEILSNMAKYSDASKVDIYLSSSAKFVDLQVIDNGIGFDVETVTKGNGLNNIQERVAMLNGDLNIKSKKGEGTRIELYFPCD